MYILQMVDTERAANMALVEQMRFVDIIESFLKFVFNQFLHFRMQLHEKNEELSVSIVVIP